MYRIQIVGSDRFGVRQLSHCYDDQTMAEEVAQAVMHYLGKNREPGAMYAVEVLDRLGRAIWRDAKAVEDLLN